MKKIILGIIIGAIIFGSIGVLGANYLYKANEVSYTPEDSEFEVDNVEDAINDLYSLTNKDYFRLNYSFILLYAAGNYAGINVKQFSNGELVDSRTSSCGYTAQLSDIDFQYFTVRYNNRAYILTALQDLYIDNVLYEKGSTKSWAWGADIRTNSAVIFPVPEN